MVIWRYLERVQLSKKKDLTKLVLLDRDDMDDKIELATAISTFRLHVEALQESSSGWMQTVVVPSLLGVIGILIVALATVFYAKHVSLEEKVGDHSQVVVEVRKDCEARNSLVAKELGHVNKTLASIPPIEARVRDLENQFGRLKVKVDNLNP